MLLSSHSHTQRSVPLPEHTQPHMCTRKKMDTHSEMKEEKKQRTQKSVAYTAYTHKQEAAGGESSVTRKK